MSEPSVNDPVLGAASAAPHHDTSGRPSDSAGQAWLGKRIPDSGFGGDDGAPDPRLEQALLDSAGAVTPTLVRAVADARWFVPVVAIPTQVTGEGAGRSDTRSEMAVVTLMTPDGSRGLPIFSGTAQLARWNPDARPVPVRAAQAASAAVAEQCHVLLVDLGGQHAVVLPPSVLWALASRREWVPAHLDGHVQAAIARVLADEPAVRRHALRAANEGGAPTGPSTAGAGTDTGTTLVLGLAPGLTATEVNALAHRVGERIAADGETRARIDALSFALETAP